jgi:hypothetical protein
MSSEICIRYVQGTPRKYSNFAQEHSHEISHLPILPVIKMPGAAVLGLAWTPLPFQPQEI